MSPWRRGVCVLLALAACEVGGDLIEVPPYVPLDDDGNPPAFYCRDENTVACQGNVHKSCKRKGEFIQAEEVDCSETGEVCDRERVCITCAATSLRCQPCEPDDEDCNPEVVQRCDDSGDFWTDVETCDLARGDACVQGECRNMCDFAKEQRSYVGCEFYGVDLDNAAINDLNNAAAQQYAIAVANPQIVPVQVTVEIDEAPFGEDSEPSELENVTVPPGSLEVFKLPRREVDGSSAEGLDDGTHTAVTSNAFRVWSTHPITAYQFNPLDNVNVFSNDASLLLPTSAVGTEYTVVAWPQTIGNSDDPSQDFDSTSDDEDLRAFLTIVGTADETDVSIELGDDVVRVVGAGPVEESGPGDLIDLTIGTFDVINLETEGFNADFTGTRIVASEPVIVFVGSEASDVPMFGTYSTRQCCADHLEEQIFPDAALGNIFSIARMPSRTSALAAAAFDDDPIEIAIVDEPEWVRVLAVAEGTTNFVTTLPPPDDEFSLRQGKDAVLQANQDFMLEGDRPAAVLQALPSQGVTGIPRQYPGGDPAIIAVPPIQQYRRDYIFLTPDKYAFDFIAITAEADTQILLDGEPLPEHCTTDPADGKPREADDPPPKRVVHRCQLSFPKVTSGESSRVFAGEQNDGVHTLVADREVGLVVYGFDRFVSYAYAGGLDLEILN